MSPTATHWDNKHNPRGTHRLEARISNPAGWSMPLTEYHPCDFNYLSTKWETMLNGFSWIRWPWCQVQRELRFSQVFTASFAVGPWCFTNNAQAARSLSPNQKVHLFQIRIWKRLMFLLRLKLRLFLLSRTSVISGKAGGKYNRQYNRYPTYYILRNWFWRQRNRAINTQHWSVKISCLSSFTASLYFVEKCMYCPDERFMR